MEDFFNKNVVIVGNPCAGKSAFYDKKKDLLFGNHVVFHTDDFVLHGFEKSLYVLLEEVCSAINSGLFVVIEGVLGFRLLRKGVETGLFYPDVVIKITVSLSEQAIRYKDRAGLEIKSGVLSMNKSNEKVFSDYIKMFNPKKPTIIVLENG